MNTDLFKELLSFALLSYWEQRSYPHLRPQQHLTTSDNAPEEEEPTLRNESEILDR